MKIINWKTGEIIHKVEYAKSVKEVVEDAVAKGISLAYVNLRYANLENANLENANLDNTNLRYANLYNANLENANLYNANLENANLENANLENANLYNANLRYANLYNANLRYADLYNANLAHANLVNAKLFNGIKTTKVTQISGLKYHIFIADNHIKIGCKCYTKEEWMNFTDGEISEMDEGALEFRKENRTKILTFADCLGE